MSTPEQRPNTYLFLSIAQTLLCCLPLGVYCIYLSTQVQGLINEGKIDEANTVSKKTKTLNFVGIGAALAIMIVWIAFFGFAAVASSNL